MRKLKSGVYQIKNLVNGNIYIGSSHYIKKRWYKHRVSLLNKTHHNKHLQHAWNKYGESNFVFEILVKCPSEYCIKLEQWFLDNLKPEYNISKIAGNTAGVVVSEETRRKISIANSGKKHSEESKKKRSLSQKGRRPSTYCLQRSKEYNSGKKLSPEHIEKLRKVHTGRIFTEETREKLRRNQTGRKYTEESKKKMSESQKGHKHGVGRVQSKTTKNKIGQSQFKTLYQYDKDNNFIQEWKSRKFVVETLLIYPRYITECCQGKREFAGGYKWSYYPPIYDDYIR